MPSGCMKNATACMSEIMDREYSVALSTARLLPIPNVAFIHLLRFALLESRPLETLRLYRGYMTSTEQKDPEELHLRVPVQSKNFLISPPGSPPVGWEPIVEEPPNTSTLAADLIAALTRVQQHEMNSGLWDSEDTNTSVDGKQVLLDNRHHAPHLGHARHESAPFMVTLEDVDAPSSSDYGYGGGHESEEVVEILDPRHEMSSSRTSSPPRLAHHRPPPGFSNIGSVKATVDSMRTAMPPMSQP